MGSKSIQSFPFLEVVRCIPVGGRLLTCTTLHDVCFQLPSPSLHGIIGTLSNPQALKLQVFNRQAHRLQTMTWSRDHDYRHWYKESPIMFEMDRNSKNSFYHALTSRQSTNDASRKRRLNLSE